MQLLVLLLSLAATPAVFACRNTINSSASFVHLFEWSWEDVAAECEEFLGPMGFQAVQVRQRKGVSSLP